MDQGKDEGQNGWVQSPVKREIGQELTGLPPVAAYELHTPLCPLIVVYVWPLKLIASACAAQYTL